MHVALCFAADSANGEVSLAQTTALERISWGFEEYLCGKAFQLKPIRDLPTHHLEGLSPDISGSVFVQGVENCNCRAPPDRF